MKQTKRAFTLIELLIVVAIIAILAAIAVPNFLEAQIRSKVARCKADMRSLATAIEEYSVDYNRPPIGRNTGGDWNKAPKLWSKPTANIACYRQITTPIAYITSIPKDPFCTQKFLKENTGVWELPYFEYKENRGLPPHNNTNAKFRNSLTLGYRWSLTSPGPAQRYGPPFEWDMFSYPVSLNPAYAPTNVYDATNGTTSIGFIIRTNKGDFGEGGLQ